MLGQMNLNVSQFRTQHEILIFVGKEQGFRNLLV